MTLLSVVTDPASFFEERQTDLSLLPAAAVVLAVAVLAVISSLLISQQTISGLPADMRGQVSTIMYISSVGGALVGTAIVWLLYAAAFHFLSTLLYEGEGSFSETLAVAGWGHLPQVATGLVSLGLLAYVFFVQGITPPDLSSAQAIQQYAQSIQRRPLLQLSTVVGIVGTLLSGYVWISGVAAVQRIDESDAFVVVAIPVAISLLLTLVNLL